VGSVVLTEGRWRRQTPRLTPDLDVHAPFDYHGNKAVNMFRWLHTAEEKEETMFLETSDRLETV